MKTFFASKTNWLGMITVLIGALGLVNDYLAHNAAWTVPGIIGIVIGVLTIVLRTFYTSDAIGTPKQVAMYQSQKLANNPFTGENPK
jgi:hypothetical protein